MNLSQIGLHRSSKSQSCYYKVRSIKIKRIFIKISPFTAENAKFSYQPSIIFDFSSRRAGGEDIVEGVWSDLLQLSKEEFNQYFVLGNTSNAPPVLACLGQNITSNLDGYLDTRDSVINGTYPIPPNANGC